MVEVNGLKIPSAEAKAAAEAAYAKADSALKAGELGAAEAGFTDFLASFPDSALGGTALYQLGRLRLLDQDPERAKKHFVQLLERFPFSEHKASVQLMLGELSLQDGAYNDAMQTLKPAFKKLEGEEKLRAARALSEASLGLEAWADALAWLAELGDLARDEKERSRVDALVLELIDGKLPAVGLATLAQSLDEDSPLKPKITMKMALLAAHLRDYRQAHALATEYLNSYPGAEDAARARELRDRLVTLAHVEPLTVGLLLPLSGKYAPFGEASLKGIGMALDLEGGRARKSPIQVIVRDTKGDPAEAARQAEKLVMEHSAIAIIGPLLRSTAMSAAAKAEELGIPLIALSSAEGLTELGGWIFRNAITDRAQAKALVDFAADTLKATHFAMLWPKKTYGIALAKHFWDAVDARGLEMRGAETYEHDDTTFKEPIKRLVGRSGWFLKYRASFERKKQNIEWTIKDPYQKQKAMEKLVSEIEPVADFEVLFIPDDYKTIGLVAPAIASEDIITNVCDERDLERIRKTTGKKKLPLVRLMGPNAWNNALLVERGQKYVHCSILVDGFFADSQHKDTRDFVEAFRRSYGADKTPGYLEAHGYDTAQIVRAVIEGSAPSTREAFRKALIGVKDFPGATGATTVRADGEFEKPLFILSVDRDGIHDYEAEGAAGGTP